MKTKDANVYLEYCRTRYQVRRLIRQIDKEIDEEIAKKSKINQKLLCKYVNSKTKVRP